ncbi:hypothetical protein UFOVP821_24 [uncultured Caudovirales phage]|uniref:Terminase n=1 Tax=uncultured Caudovirales phage TaxID=2100421 RepID=A0A6J5P812_9CAUD|nr:hypothetical protein UFOVP821_24 [uncultured Caudovirales phage]
MTTVAEVQAALPFLTPDERALLDELLCTDEAAWRPLPGPQRAAYDSQADIVGYGGAAGGGKTDLACGLAITQHQRTLIVRREATQLTGIIDRLTELLGSREGYNGQEKTWRLPGRQVEFGSTPNLGDETKYQGRPHDLLVFDEATNLLEHQVRFLMGWLRTTNPKQRCRALLTFNPPTSSEGRWVIGYFAPWLDPKHPNPARYGELRWFTTINGQDVECESGEPFMHEGELIKPLSRTFIPSRVSDNPYLAGTSYAATLNALPEPLRSQMLKGDFQAGMEDSPWQVIPTGWVDAAMARWQARDVKGEMSCVGVDVARGGRDETVIARRHGNWYDEPLGYAGKQTPDGPAVAGLVLAATRDNAPITIDVIGVGASPYDFLNERGIQVMGVNVGERSEGTDLSGRLRFANLRSELWWKFRESLDPANGLGVALPPSSKLSADLCAPMWSLRSGVIVVESREDIVKRIGRSPDYASAYMLAALEIPNLVAVRRASAKRERQAYDPYAKVHT